MLEKALKFIFAKAEEKKDNVEFVEDFGAEMYNLFLERGYIHELISSGDEDFEWQITKLGLRRKVEIFS